MSVFHLNSLSKKYRGFYVRQKTDWKVGRAHTPCRACGICRPDFTRGTRGSL